MNIARELERRLERLVDGLSAAVFRGKMHPVDLANRLLRAVDLSVVDGPLGPTIDNTFAVRVHPGELDEAIDTAALDHELSAAVSGLASEKGWRLGGAVRVTVTAHAGVGMGSIKVSGSNTPGGLDPWAVLIDTAGGTVLEVCDNRNLVGRAEDCDVVVDDSQVSRHHAVLTRAGGRVAIRDLGSSNGTWVSGRRARATAMDVAPGDEITLGPASFSFRLV